MARKRCHYDKIDIISGFLGAGKTTFIKKLLKEAIAGEKVVLIENEFGEIGIDGGFLKDSGIEIREMNSGCICCSLVGDFGRSLNEVLTKYTPDRVIIEPSGVGKLSDVMKAVCDVAGEIDVVLNGSVTVVDAQKCKMYMKNFGEFFNNQIESAGTIVLSRTDVADADKVAQCVEMIREKNPKAAIVTTPIDKLTGEQLLEIIEKPTDDMAEKLLEEVKRAITIIMTMTTRSAAVATTITTTMTMMTTKMSMSTIITTMTMTKSVSAATTITTMMTMMTTKMSMSTIITTMTMTKSADAAITITTMMTMMSTSTTITMTASVDAATTITTTIMTPTRYSSWGLETNRTITKEKLESLLAGTRTFREVRPGSPRKGNAAGCGRNMVLLRSCSGRDRDPHRRSDLHRKSVRDRFQPEGRRVKGCV